MRNLGPQHHQSVSLCDALDRALQTGVVALGEVTISVADVDLLYLGLQLVLTSIEAGSEPGLAGGYRPKSRCGGQGGRRAALPLESSDATTPVRPMVSAPVTPIPREECAQAPLLASPGLPVTTTNSVSSSQNKNGLGRLVLTLVKVLHELLKRQAVRRMEAGSLSIAEMERLGVSLMRQAQEIERMANDLGLKERDLNLDLGPLGKLL